MFEENTKTWTQYTGKLEKVAARRKRQISLVESLDHRAMKAARNLDSQKHLSKRQEDKERERRDSSLERHRKEFEGVRGFSYTAGRFRTFDDGTTKPPKRTNRKRLAKSRTLSQRNKRGANLSRPKPKAKPMAKRRTPGRDHLGRPRDSRRLPLDCRPVPVPNKNGLWTAQRRPNLRPRSRN